MHGLALSFVETEEWKTMFGRFNYIILCGECRGHYFDFIDAYDKTYLESKEKAFKFTVDLHNSINKKLDKPELSINDALKNLQKLTDVKPFSKVLSEFDEWMFNINFPKYNNQHELDEPKKIVREFFDFIKNNVPDDVFSRESFPACI